MNPKVKLTVYALLLILAVWFGLAFRSNYAAVTKAAAAEGADTTSTDTSQSQPALTNTEAASTNSTNAVTNTAAQTTNDTNPQIAATNAVAGDIATNATAGTATNAPAPAPSPPPAPIAAAGPSSRGAMIGYLAGLVLVVGALGLMIAYDLTQVAGNQAANFLFFDVGDAMRNPDYEKAEAEWANGKFLEAIQLLRDYLKKNPREMHAALRIAEIYEKDLKNYLASALEYEEVLKHRLPAERWGWAAIHLCNLYSKLNQQDKTLALLHRIVNEYSRTAAAKKARTRLGIVEPEEVQAPTEPAVEPVDETAEQTYSIEAQEPEQETQEQPAPPEAPKSNLPPGFRPKN
ncbi:MAG TPA: hypothetical protein VGN61_15480 [Verrucomicrobiae bacterium]